MNETLCMELPIRAVGYNNYCKSTRTGRRFITPKGREYKSELMKCLSKYKDQLIEIGLTLEWPMMLDIEIHYYYLNYINKSNGLINQKMNDSDSPDKIVIDSIFEMIGCDDYLKRKGSHERHLAKNKDYIIVFLSLSEDLNKKNMLTVI